MKLKAIGTNVLCRRVMLRKKNPVTNLVVPGTDGQLRHPGTIPAGLVLSAGEGCTKVRIGDVVILNVNFQIASFGQDETEFLCEEYAALAVVTDFEEWDIDQSDEAFKPAVPSGMVYPLPADAPRNPGGKKRH